MFCRCYGYNCTHLQNFTSYYSADCSQKKSHCCPGIYHQDQGKQVPYFILGISCQVAEKQEMILPLRYKKEAVSKVETASFLFGYLMEKFFVQRSIDDFKLLLR